MRVSITLPCLCLLLGTVTMLAQPLTGEKARSTGQQVDQYIGVYLRQHGIKPNEIIDDATFARRAYISIAGRIPTADEARSFLEDSGSNKRSKLIDSLVGSPGYKSRMFNFWADLLRVKTQLDKHGLGWHVWLRDAVEQNMPYDDFVNAMLSAKGLATDNPALGYYLRDRNMLLDNVSNTVQVFLGTQIGCAQCHDHPFDDWTQKQYYELSAFVGSTKYKNETADNLLRNLVDHSIENEGIPDLKKGENSRKTKELRRAANKKYYRDYGHLFNDFRNVAISDDANQKMRLPKDYQYNDGKPGEILSPKTLFGDPIPDDIPPEQGRKALADWITSSNNPLFTKVIVNRLWAEVFGRGIVDPLDDWSDTTRISHPELLDYLCRVMAEVDYDVQQFMRILYNTRLFATAAADEEAGMGREYDFRGPVLRRMSAEEVHDSFLTLRHGNQDEVRNKELQYRWKKYVQTTGRILNMSLPELIELDEHIDVLEEQTYALRSEARELKIAADKARGEGEMDKARGLDQQSREKYKESKNTESMSRNMMAASMMQAQAPAKSKIPMRASENAAPARPGSFLRQFGSSDRMTPDASNTVASVPQTLTLLNGKEITRLTDGKGELAIQIRQAESSAERLDILFLSIYGCLPTDKERQQYEPLTTERTQLIALARAMINSKRFLFVQ